MMRVLAAALLIAGFAGPAHADVVEIEKIEAFLLQGQSGTLSADILHPDSAIGFWNVIIGEGGAAEGSDDVLVVVHFKRLKDEAVPSQTLFTVMDEFGKVIARSENFDLFFGNGDRAAKAFLLEKATCRSVKLEVKVNDKAASRQLPFECGE
jgi:hypothetical protein